MDKKITLQILSVEIFRFFFIFIMILCVSLVSIHSGQRNGRRIQEPPRVMPSSIPEPLADEHAGGFSVYGALSGHMNKKEQLFHPIIIQVSSRHQVDPALVKAIIMAESGYNPKAISKRGAKGLMQLMPSTAEALGVEDIFNPKQNISGGVRYFKQLVNKFDGNIKLALAAYNAGSRNVREYQGIPPFKTTRFYIKKVFKYYQLYKDKMPGKIDSA